MPYVPSVEVNFSQKPTTYHVPCLEHSIEFMLGSFVEEEILVFMSVSFICLDADEKAYDIRFGTFTQCAKKSYNVSPVDFSYNGSRKFVLREERQLVLSLVVKASEILDSYAQPKVLTMHTFHTDLPQGGLTKYYVIGSCLERIGYNLVDKMTDADGRTWWQYVRNP
jgi:hypothetical protein